MAMRYKGFMTAGLALLAGCDAGDSTTGNSADTASSMPQADAAAAPATEKADVDCDKFKPQTAARGQPADDIVGLRNGMTQDQVRGVLLCKNASYAINVSKNSASLPSGAQMSQINLNADTGLDKVNVWLLGPPGGERVVHIDRTTEYSVGKELPIANIAQEVAGKYGMFDDTNSGNQSSGWIVRARDGARMTNSNSSYFECRSHSLRTDKVLPCLHAISYQITPSSQNPALASRFNVALTSFAMTNQMATATSDYHAKATERAEQQAEKGQLEL